LSDGITVVVNSGKVLAMELRLVSVKYWPTWFVVGVAWLLCRLPLQWQMKVGRSVGRIAYRMGGRRRIITEANIGLCFPELNNTQQTALVRRTFISTGMALMETIYAWLRPVDQLASRIEVFGLDVLKRAQGEGHGVMLVGAHFLTLDLAGAFIATITDMDVIYRYNKNPVINYLMVKGRKRLYGRVIERTDVRKSVRCLQASRTVWYAADQDYGRRHSVFAPFFGQPAATITATSRMATINHSPVVFFSHFRNEKSLTWSLHFKRVGGYPTGDDVVDATNLNHLIETEIRKHPEQYLWLHRRFKTRPQGISSPYT
jgi:KDO2-lipid IV(A) lauroyltransferase